MTKIAKEILSKAGISTAGVLIGLVLLHILSALVPAATLAPFAPAQHSLEQGLVELWNAEDPETLSSARSLCGWFLAAPDSLTSDLPVEVVTAADDVCSLLSEK